MGATQAPVSCVAGLPAHPACTSCPFMFLFPAAPTGARGPQDQERHRRQLAGQALQVAVWPADGVQVPLLGQVWG